MTNRHFTAALLAAALMAGSASAQAADFDFTTRITAGLAHAVAEQGNQAFRELRQEFKQNLTEALKPLLPAASPAKADAGLPEYVELHESARVRQ